MCCSDGRNLTPGVFFICITIKRTPGRDNVHIKRLASVRLLPLVKPLDPIKLAISVYSIQRSGETLEQKILVLCMTNNPPRNSLRILGYNFVISCRKQYNDLPQLLWSVQQNKVACIGAKNVHVSAP